MVYKVFVLIVILNSIAIFQLLFEPILALRSQDSRLPDHISRRFSDFDIYDVHFNLLVNHWRLLISRIIRQLNRPLSFMLLLDWFQIRILDLIPRNLLLGLLIQRLKVGGLVVGPIAYHHVGTESSRFVLLNVLLVDDLDVSLDQVIPVRFLPS